MKKVKIISSSRAFSELESKVNEFIKDKNVLDIQYRGINSHASVMIVYEDSEISALTGMSSTEAPEPKYETVSVKI